MRARLQGDRVIIICPACRDVEISRGYTDPADGGVAGEHAVPFSGERAWSFNGDLARPTLSPSLLLTYTHVGADKFVCHSFVRAGRIEYLPDCTHPFAGQTVDLPEWPFQPASPED